VNLYATQLPLYRPRGFVFVIVGRPCSRVANRILAQQYMRSGGTCPCDFTVRLDRRDVLERRRRPSSERHTRIREASILARVSCGRGGIGAVSLAVFTKIWLEVHERAPNSGKPLVSPTGSRLREEGGPMNSVFYGRRLNCAENMPRLGEHFRNE
jgi:hypothetical protein